MTDEKREIIKPRNLSGFPDFLPRQALYRNWMIETIRGVFESYGFQPLETPILEWSDIILGKYGEEGGRQIYRFTDHGKRDVAMRFDHTVPLARVVAQYDGLPKPFKRYTVGPAFRGEKAQAGRYRQFVQMDCDIVGVKSALADAEIAAIMVKTLEALGVEDFILRINSREVLTAYCKDVLGLTELETAQSLRVVDKLDKIGLEAVSKELRCDIEGCQKDEMWRAYEIDKDGNPHAEPPLELAPPIADNLLKLVTIKADTNEAAIEAMAKVVADSHEATLGIEDLRKCVAWLPDYGVREDVVRVDPSVVRGLDYYTGIVYEAYLVGYENLGSIFGGGRYDKLIGKYLNRDVPAVGTSIGVDRLYDCLEIIGKTSDVESNTDVLIINFDESMIPDYIRLSEKLRAAGINNEVYPERKHFGDQVKYAMAKSISYALILGEEEKAKGVVQVKDLATKEQVEVEKDKLIGELKDLLCK